MTYDVEISPQAELDLMDAYSYLKDNAQEGVAEQWFSDISQFILSLDSSPRRGALAYENDAFDREVRQLFFNKHFRVIYGFEEKEGIEVVQVFRVRHTSQEYIASFES